jgi:tol-pal system protein YbgF
LEIYGVSMRLTGAALLVVMAATVSPAAAAADKTHLQMMAEIRMLQEQQQQLQSLLGSLQDTLKTVVTKLDDQSGATRKAMADQTLATTNIGDNVRVLREKTDETNVRISTIAQELEALRQTIASQPPPQVTAANPPIDPALSSPGGAPPVQPTMTAPPGTSPQRMYETSMDDYTAGRYDLAIQGFQGFLQLFGKLPQAAGATYNIGMSYYNQGKWAEARDSFLKVINDYPQAQGSTLPDAYFKLGQAYEKLNQIDNARKAYEAAVQKFPGPPSTLSSQSLLRLKGR